MWFYLRTSIDDSTRLGMIALEEVFHKEFSKKVKHGRNNDNRAFNLEWISFLKRILQKYYVS